MIISRRTTLKISGSANFSRSWGMVSIPIVDNKIYQNMWRFAFVGAQIVWLYSGFRIADEMKSSATVMM